MCEEEEREDGDEEDEDEEEKKAKRIICSIEEANIELKIYWLDLKMVHCNRDSFFLPRNTDTLQVVKSTQTFVAMCKYYNS